MSNTNIEPLAVSINEAGKMLSISRSSIYRYIYAGNIRPVQLGRRQVIPVSQLKEILDSGVSEGERELNRDQFTGKFKEA